MLLKVSLDKLEVISITPGNGEKQVKKIYEESFSPNERVDFSELFSVAGGRGFPAFLFALCCILQL